MSNLLSDLRNNWNGILSYLKEGFNISEVSYKTWLSSLQVENVEDGNRVVLTVDSTKVPALGISHIINNYGIFIKNAIEEKIGEEVSIDIKGSSAADEKPKDQTPRPRTPGLMHNLNPRYTFDNFVVSSNNQLSHAAALAVAEAPFDNPYNPLFIYGEAGLGKTHLMQSIAHYIIEHHPELKVMYVQSEIFTNELIEAIRHGATTPPEFRAKYRNVDVLLVDDIQFIIGKERTQEEFFHTFNALYEAKKQIVISSDKPPKELVTLEERLKSRFEWGLMTDISIPDFETKMAILRRKAEMDNIEIGDDILEYIAFNITSNVRELEGSLNKINAMSRLQKRDISLSLAQEAIRDIVSPNDRKNITCDFIIDTVAEHFDINPQEIRSKGRSKNVAYPRQIVMYLCKKLTGSSITKIGEILDRDHSTVLHGYNKIEDDISKDQSIRNTVDMLIKKINPDN